MQVKIKEVEGSVLEIEGEIPAEEFEGERQRALKILAGKIEVPGFRPGHLPEKILESRLGGGILEEMARLALAKAYPKIIEEKQLKAVGRPEITITKIASGNPLGFKIRQAILPEIVLPDWRKISAEIVNKEKNRPPPEASDQEVEAVLESLRAMRRSGKELPALDDQFAKSLGDFKNLMELKQKIGENLKLEKGLKERDTRRLEILEAIIEKTSFELPEILVERELLIMVSELEGRLREAGSNLEKYLKAIAKTKEAWLGEIRPEAQKRVRLGLVLEAIARAEKITISPEQIEKETKKILERFPGARRPAAALYVEEALRNKEVFRLLETLSGHLN